MTKSNSPPLPLTQPAPRPCLCHTAGGWVFQNAACPEHGVGGLDKAFEQHGERKQSYLNRMWAGGK